MALIPRINREDMKGQILKTVVTRIDYQDTFGLAEETRKEIYKICEGKGIAKKLRRPLEEIDFQTYDPVNIFSVTYESIKEVFSDVIYNDERGFYIEINQFFILITQEIDSHYENYSFTSELIQEILKVLKEKETLHILKVSIRKSNEVYYENFRNIHLDFKSEVIGFDIFNGEVNWQLPYTTSESKQSFEWNEQRINFMRVFDSGKLNGKKLFRLYLQFEVYDIDLNFIKFQDKVNEKLSQLNNTLYLFFEHTLTDAAVDKLKVEEGKLGDNP